LIKKRAVETLETNMKTVAAPRRLPLSMALSPKTRWNLPGQQHEALKIPVRNLFSPSGG
jgi:hypothetical protein